MNQDKKRVIPKRETDIALHPEERLDIRKILDGLEHFHSPRRPCHWREVACVPREVGDFTYLEASKPLVLALPFP